MSEPPIWLSTPSEFVFLVSEADREILKRFSDRIKRPYIEALTQLGPLGPYEFFYLGDTIE